MKLSSLSIPPVKCLLLWPLVVIMASSDSPLFCRFKKKLSLKGNSKLYRLGNKTRWEGEKKITIKHTPPPQAHKNYTVEGHPIYDQICLYINFKPIWVQLRLYYKMWVFFPHFSEKGLLLYLCTIAKWHKPSMYCVQQYSFFTIREHNNSSIV